MINVLKSGSLMLMYTLRANGLHANNIAVVTPEEGTIMVTGRTFTVEWINPENDTTYDIDLFFCGSSEHLDTCGSFVTMLCQHGDSCMDEEGDFDIVVPEPLLNMPTFG